MANPQVADPLAPYADTIDAAAHEWGQDPTMLRALILQESGGNAGSVSSAGARGLGNIMPKTATGLGVTDPSDPTQQIFGAAKYLAEGFAKEKTPEGALLYYHGGPDWRKRYGPESAGYVPAVAAHYTRLSKGAGSDNSAAPAVSDDEFLKQSAPPPAAAAPSDEEFLKSTGAAPGAPAPEAGAGPDVAGLDVSKMTPEPDYAGAVKTARQLSTVAGVRNALEPPEGYTTSGILPMATKTDPATGEGNPALGLRWDLGPLRPLATGVLDLLEGPRTGTVTPEARNALFGAMTGGQLLPSLARGTGAAIADSMAAPLAKAFRDNPLAPGYAGPRAVAAPGQALPAPGMGAAQPTQATGAQVATAAEAHLTPAEVQAYRSTAEGQKFLEGQQPGEPDRNQYIPGSNANAAEIEQSVNTARELKSLNVTAPGVSQEAKEIAAANNEARSRYLQDTIKSPVDINNAKDARKAQLEKDYPAAFANAKDADAQPVVETITDLLGGARNRQNTQLQTYVKPLLNRLVDEKGNLKITDPEELYGFREDLRRMRSKASKANDPNLNHVSDEIGTIMDATDKAIEKAAPGYRQYMDNYAAASRKIDEMDVLQGHEKGLYDSQNRMTYSGVQRMMKNIVDSRRAGGINQYQSISEETMQRLWNLRDDLRRSASAQELARTPGSDTVQNAWDAAKGVLGGIAGDTALHVGANATLGAAGSPVVAVVKSAANALMAGRTQRKQTARGMKILHPDPSQLRNPLAGP